MKSYIYSDDYYIGKNKNNEMINTLIEIGNKNKDLFNNLNNQNIELINLYNIFISKCSKLITELDSSNNPILYSRIISNIIAFGYFSYNIKEFNYESITSELISKRGISIINGEGKCRHFSAFNKDILTSLNLYCEEFFCTTTEKKYDQILSKANHSANIINYKNKIYGIDISNNSLLNFINIMDIKTIYNEESYTFHFKPYLYYALGCQEQDINKLISLFEKSIKLKTLSEEEFKNIIDNANDIVFENIYLLEEFNKDTNKLKRNIKTLLLNKKTL